MAEIFIGGETDDYFQSNEFWYPGTGISSYSGGEGKDTLDFSNADEGWLWFEPTRNWVQDPTVPLGYIEELGQEAFAWATILFFEVIFAGSGNDTVYINSGPVTVDSGLGNDTFLYHPGFFDDGDHYAGNLGNDVLDFTDQIDAFVNMIFNATAGTITYDGKVATISGFENYLAGFGDDTLIPGLGPDVMNGGVGNDLFNLSAGVFSSGATYIGGIGWDTLAFGGFDGDYTVDLTAGGMSSAGAFSSFAFVSGFEAVTAGRGDDTLIGMDGTQTLNGGSGDDSIDGMAGADTLTGGRGNDQINGGNGRDTIFGDNGNDEIKGGGNNDRIFGGNGKDDVAGGKGRDTVYGDAGHDTIDGNAGDDRLYGGGKDDRIDGGAGDDTVSGGSGDDRLFGGKGDDEIRGGTGNDRLFGEKGADTLNGGSGDDTINGGGGADLFLFADGHGADAVRDFETGLQGEQIDLSGVAALSDFADVLAAAWQTDDGLLITTGDASSILLVGLTLNDLDAGDFVF